MKKKLLLTVLLLFTSLIFYAQEGTVSGILEDKDGPLPGVSINIKGTTIGTDTDFDGKYSIRCKVGDILVYSYLGFRTREVVVTPQMFGDYSEGKITFFVVKLIRSNAYANAIKKFKKHQFATPNIRTSNRTYNKISTYDALSRIRNIQIDSNKAELTYFNPDVFFEVGYDGSFGARFVRDQNTPALQSTFSQGRAQAGNLAYLGPETSNVFSYGPALSSLEFDGSSYLYDSNGRLVPSGNGNGTPANAYDNSVFEQALRTMNRVYFNISTASELYQFDLVNRSAKDIFNRERNTDNKISLVFNKPQVGKETGWNALITYHTKKDNQPNINGFQNNLLLNAWSTPATFSNAQGFVLPDNTQRSFGPFFNNPEWLLNNNRNAIEDDTFAVNVHNITRLNDDFKIESFINFKYQDELQQFGLVQGTVGFEQGFSSDKQITRKDFNANSIIEYRKSKNYNELLFRSKINYRYDDLDFNFIESTGFTPFSFSNPQNSLQREQQNSRSRLTLLNQVRYDIQDKIELEFTNNSYFSSIQNNKWFLPSFGVKLDMKDLLNIYDINTFSFSSNLSFDVNDLSLYYSNLSHNSLLLFPSQSWTYTTNNDLFLNSSVALEERRNFEVGADLSLYLFGDVVDFAFTYYNNKTSGSVFPILNSNIFELSNVADIRNSGFEFTMKGNVYISDEFSYSPKISFSTYNTKVLELQNSASRIPIAGFATVSQNLIVGQPAGVITGSAYQRDAQNNILIGDDGFPLMNNTPQIIGNPIPDFNLGFSNRFEWKQLNFEFVLDIQKGGDIWNGTQNILNYIGTSQQSADQRGTTNFVFTGVNQQGNPNTVPVSFYDPNVSFLLNRFVRYGFEGIAEEAIVDASYFNVKSINISYDFIDKYNQRFFREIQVGMYANNLITWSRFRGRNPYGSLYGNVSGQQLNFFNTPLLSEVGLTLKIRI